MDKRYSDMIHNANELEFVVFCIENVSAALKLDTSILYDALTKKSDILYRYIVPNYGILHTQGKEYIVDDIIEVIKEEGVQI